MTLSYGIGELVSYLDVLLSTVFVLAGFMFAAFSFGFRREVSAPLKEGTVQKAFDYRNDSRKLLRQFFSYACVLLILRLASSPLNLLADARWLEYILLALSVCLTLPMLWLLRETYRFYFNSTVMKGTGVV